jgi:SAM-dependent methyltransferase
MQLPVADQTNGSGGGRPDAPLAGTKLQPDFVPCEHGYHLRDLLRFHHVAFIDACYRAILLRGPDDEGFRHAFEFLERGGSKIRFLGALRYSLEGRARNVAVAGLQWRYLLERAFRVPVLGYLLETTVAIIRSPLAVRHHRALEFYTAGQLATVAASATRMTEIARTEVAVLKDVVLVSLERQIADLRSDVVQVSSALPNLKAGVAKVSGEIEWIKGAEAKRAADALELKRQIADLRSDVVQVSSALPNLKAGVAKVSGEIEWIKGAEAREAAKARDMDSFYVALEDRFRGSRTEIKSRVAEYLPVLAEAKVVSTESPLLDLGCGRGEWLEVLRDNGLPGRGVDLNAISVADCRERGLDVAQADAISYLTSLADESLGAITSMHLVEHLPFQLLLELLAECRRTLKTGGLLIVETPNPSNVLVGSNTFYLDPTHRNPIPSALLRFVAESVGFENVSVMDLHPSDHQWSDIRSEMDQYLIQNLFGAQDYAVVGHKH